MLVCWRMSAGGFRVLEGFEGFKGFKGFNADRVAFQGFQGFGFRGFGESGGGLGGFRMRKGIWSFETSNRKEWSLNMVPYLL